MSNVGECEGWSVKCRVVWRSDCQVYRRVKVGVSSVGECGGRSVNCIGCGGWSIKCRGVWKLEFQVYRRVEVGVSSVEVGVSIVSGYGGWSVKWVV